MKREEEEIVLNEIERAVYVATVSIFERLEHERHLVGNGHHAAQKVAAFAADELKRRVNRDLGDSK